MPGRTPAEAFEAFIEPIERAIACLGRAKVTTTPGGRHTPGVVHAWALNATRGMAFPGGWHFEPVMHYEFVQGAFSGEWKVKTRGYAYRLAYTGRDLWRIHWHPSANSTYQLPHIHIPAAPRGGDGMALHHPTGRITLEDAVEWVLNQEIKPARDDWRDVLAQSRELHVQHRSWSDRPPASLGRA